MITRIEAYRYRCFRNLAVDLGPYHVLVGKNGAGKSTLLDIPVLLGEALKGRNVASVFFEPTPSHPRPRADAPLELIYNHEGDWFAFAIEVRLPDSIRDTMQRTRIESANKKTRAALESNPGRVYDALRYELALRVEEGALEISQEHLFLLPEDRTLLGSQKAGLWGEFIEDDELNTIRVLLDRDRSSTARIKGENRHKDAPKDSPVSIRPQSVTPALCSIPMDMELFAATHWMMDFLSEKAFRYAPNLEKLRTAIIPPGRNWNVSPDASTLAWSILELEKNPDAFEEWLEHIKSVLPMLTHVEAKRRENDGLAYFQVHYGAARKVSNSGLSDGTLSILALTILAFVDNVPGVLMVEEPENGIHPKAIEAVLETLNAIPGSQVWVTTHSPIAVAVTPLEHLLCLEQQADEGVVVTTGTDHPHLKHWHGTPSLSTLHSAGVL